MLPTHIQFLNLRLVRKQNLIISLTQIFGINFYFATEICKKYGFNKISRLEDVSISLLNEFRKYILAHYLVQNSLKVKNHTAIQELIGNHSVRGFRLKLKLPVRGQRTRTNHKTQKKLLC